MRRLIASPRPAPACAPGSSRVNSWKIDSCFSAGIPGPVSVTLVVTHGPGRGPPGIVGREHREAGRVRRQQQVGVGRGLENGPEVHWSSAGLPGERSRWPVEGQTACPRTLGRPTILWVRAGLVLIC